MTTLAPFAVGDITIGQLDGLFSLNDLHRASGGEPKHRPGYFLEAAQTRALAAEIETAGNPAVKAREGRNGGTYACRELVVAYAAWISAPFHLKVLRVFLEATRPSSPALDYERISPAQAQEIKELVDRVVASGRYTYPQTWGRLHSKFRVNSYLALAAAQFDEVQAYFLGKLPERPDGVRDTTGGVLTQERKAIQETRRERLRELVMERGWGFQAAMAQKLGKRPDYVSRMLSTRAHQKGIPGDTAREIERALGLPVMWLDGEAAPLALPAPASTRHADMEGSLLERASRVNELSVLLEGIARMAPAQDGVLMRTIRLACSIAVELHNDCEVGIEAMA